MRVGINPEKIQNTLTTDYYHRIVIPVYIPNLTEPYFKDGLKILKLCLESLFLSIHSKTKVSIINNGCCDEVTSYLETIYNQNNCVDQLLNSKINLGKVNALYSAIKSNLEPLITIADADVLFLPKWQEEVETVFVNFPEAGMVSPVPSSIAYRGKYVNSTIYYALLKGKLKFKTVKDPDGLVKFQESVGRQMYTEAHLDKNLVLSNKNGSAVLGCGHFMATLRAEVFEHAPTEICQHKIVGGSENKYIDAPNDKGGFLRLSTLGNYGYHLGNAHENWMDECFETIKQLKRDVKPLDFLPKVKSVGVMGYSIGKLLHYLLFKKIKKQYFSIKGMKQSY